MSVLVCYLVVPGYEAAAKAFVDSYTYHDPGMQHDFAYVMKGESDINLHYLPWCADTVLYKHTNHGFDIRSLQKVCWDHPSYDWVMWFGSNCRILSKNWLSKFYRTAMRPGVVAVAASGSYEAGISHQQPNPHLRTSCLLIAPAVLNELGFSPADTREDCYHFEHGPCSLYRRLQARGFRAMVVGRDGYGYEEPQWPTSRIYRCENQQNLLVADNQTDAYLAADPEERVVLEKMAWTR